jgi:putative resolvase
VAGVELSEWAGLSGVSRQGVTWWLDAGVLAAGTVLVGAQERATAGVTVCAWVSSCGQGSGLGWRVAWLAGYLTGKGIASSKVVCGVGSGRNGHRTRLLSLLRDVSVGTVVAGPWERLACFGVGYLEAALAARGGKRIVVGQAEVSDDLVRDMAGVLRSLCARLCGCRSAGHRAERALAVAGGEQAA